MPIKLVGTCFVALALAAASMTAAADQQPDAEVEILKFKFIPQEITIKAGDTIRWTNVEKRQYHSVWFEQAGDPEADQDEEDHHRWANIVVLDLEAKPRSAAAQNRHAAPNAIPSPSAGGIT